MSASAGKSRKYCHTLAIIFVFFFLASRPDVYVLISRNTDVFGFTKKCRLTEFSVPPDSTSTFNTSGLYFSRRGQASPGRAALSLSQLS